MARGKYIPTCHKLCLFKKRKKVKKLILNLPAYPLPGVHALCSDLAAIFPHLLPQGKNKVGHDYMIEQTFVMSLKRGIFPLETKAHNRTIAISLFLHYAGTYTTGARSGY
jgi:hypothetical protein